MNLYQVLGIADTEICVNMCVVLKIMTDKYYSKPDECLYTMYDRLSERQIKLN
jgi:hypothetical protein